MKVSLPKDYKEVLTVSAYEKVKESINYSDRYIISEDKYVSNVCEHYFSDVFTILKTTCILDISKDFDRLSISECVYITSYISCGDEILLIEGYLIDFMEYINPSHSDLKITRYRKEQ